MTTQQDDKLTRLYQQLADYMAAVRESRERGLAETMNLRDTTALMVFREMDIPLRRVEEKYNPMKR